MSTGVRVLEPANVLVYNVCVGIVHGFDLGHHYHSICVAFQFPSVVTIMGMLIKTGFVQLVLLCCIVLHAVSAM